MKRKIKENIENPKVIYIKDIPCILSYTIEDEFFMRKAIAKNSNRLINNGNEFYIENSIIQKMYAKLEEEKYYWHKYEIAYLMYLHKILIKDFNLEKINMNENFLKFGYTNTEIINYMKKGE